MGGGVLRMFENAFSWRAGVLGRGRVTGGAFGRVGVLGVHGQEGGNMR